MKLLVRALLLVPVWAITSVVKPFFPASHPWKNKRMSLWSWARFGTSASVAFGAGFWFLGCTVPTAMWCLQTGRHSVCIALSLLNLTFVLWFIHQLDTHGL